MIKISSYSLGADGVHVKLNCSCGSNEILQRGAGNESQLICRKCGHETTLQALRDVATTYWKGRRWILKNAIKEQRKSTRHEIDIPLEIFVKSSQDSAPLCQFIGRGILINAGGMLCAIQDFSEEYFQALTTTHRFAVIRPNITHSNFPQEVFTRIVGIKYNPADLPLAQLSVSFKVSSSPAQQQIERYCELLARESGDTSR